MIKIGVSGACGKMGRRIINLAGKDKELEVAFGLEADGHDDIGKIVDGAKITDDPQEIKNCDCLIEFTSPQATLAHLGLLKGYKKPAVIGTTGLTKLEEDTLKEAARVIPIVFSPNMSIGVNLLFRMLKEAAKVLAGYKAEIFEVHHIHKKDSPSGTAKKIAEILNGQGFGIKTEEINAERKGEVIGDHRVVLESDLDRVELFHSAKTRDIFAQGALLAAKWIVGRPLGLHSIDDLLADLK